jgi:hypothetical protein
MCNMQLYKVVYRIKGDYEQHTQVIKAEDADHAAALMRGAREDVITLAVELFDKVVMRPSRQRPPLIR